MRKSNSINGLNLYAYANNNPVGIAYSSSGFVGSALVEWWVHHTVSLIEDPVISWIFGNISYTTTVQLNSSEIFYSFSNIGNDGYSAGVGMNLGN